MPSLEDIITKHFSSLKTIDLRAHTVMCDGSENCFLKKLSEFAGPSNIKSIWERDSNSLEKTLVGRKDLNIPYELIKCIEIFTFGYFGKRGFGGRNEVNERICVRYPNKDAPVRFPISAYVRSNNCKHVLGPWVFVISEDDDELI